MTRSSLPKCFINSESEHKQHVKVFVSKAISARSEDLSAYAKESLHRCA